MGEKDSAHRHDFAEHQHMVFPLEKVQHGVCVGCIMGHPTDIICLPICTLFTKTSFHSHAECGPWSASVVEKVAHLLLLVNIGPLVMRSWDLRWSLINAYGLRPTGWCTTTLVSCFYNNFKTFPVRIITVCMALNSAFFLSVRCVTNWMWSFGEDLCDFTPPVLI